jgi:hypothetical protein
VVAGAIMAFGGMVYDPAAMGGCAGWDAESPRRRRSTPGWIVGRAVASVALLVLVVPAGCSGEGAEPSARRSEFGPVDDLCDAVDFTPVFQVHAFTSAVAEERTEDRSVNETSTTSAIYQTTCILDDSTGRSAQDAGPQGLMVASVVIYDTAEIASQVYEGLVGPRADSGDGLGGRWEGSRVTSQETSYGSEVTLTVRDDVLILNLRLAISTWSTPPDPELQEAAVAQLAENMSDVMRR